MTMKHFTPDHLVNYFRLWLASLYSYVWLFRLNEKLGETGYSVEYILFLITGEFPRKHLVLTPSVNNFR